MSHQAYAMTILFGQKSAQNVPLMTYWLVWYPSGVQIG